MWEAIPSIVESHEKNPHIRSIVVTGAGSDAFAAGADITEFDDHRATDDGAKLYDAATHAATRSIARCTKPVIAAIRGICYGGGMALAMACDLRLATTDAKFCIPAAKLGVGYSYDGMAALVAKLGAALTAEVLFTARSYAAQEALVNGIVHALAPQAEFDALVDRYTSAIADNAPLSIAAAKSAIGAILSDNTQDRCAAEARVAACMASEDYREGRAAFLEKRKPRFQGR